MKNRGGARSVYSDFDLEVQRDEALRHAISEAEQGTLEPLIQQLNDPRPIPDTLRRWFVSLFDPASSAPMKATIRRRNAGKPTLPGPGVAAAACFIVANITADAKLEYLLAKAIENYSIPGQPISRSSLRRYLRSHWPDLSEKFKEAKRIQKTGNSYN
jgi:hypothetical protein